LIQKLFCVRTTFVKCSVINVWQRHSEMTLFVATLHDSVSNDDHSAFIYRTKHSKTSWTSQKTWNISNKTAFSTSYQAQREYVQTLSVGCVIQIMHPAVCRPKHLHQRVLYDFVRFKMNLWAGQRSRYRDWLQAGRSGDRIPVEARFSAPVHTGPGAHPASCTMGTGSFSGVKSGQGLKLTPHTLLVPWSWKSRAIPLLPYEPYGLYRASVPVQ
jgi:hypothetical protein